MVVRAMSDLPVGGHSGELPPLIERTANADQPFIDGLSAAGCIIASPQYRQKTGMALEKVSLLIHYQMIIRPSRSIARKVMCFKDRPT